jgi:hypothetical protein
MLQSHTDDIYGTMRDQSGDKFANQRKVYEIGQRIIGWRMSFPDDACSEQLSTVRPVKVKAHINQLIRDNRRIITDETASKMSIYYVNCVRGVAYGPIENNLF